MTDLRKYGKIIQKIHDRSYVISIDGTKYRRNRGHLIPVGYDVTSEKNLPWWMHLEGSGREEVHEDINQAPQCSSGMVLRSGRRIQY